MRILCAHSHPDRTETALLIELARRGHAVQVACHPDARFHGRLVEAGLPVTPVVFHHRVDGPAIRQLRALCAGHRIEIVHAFNKRFLANGLLATLGTGTPFVTYRGTVGTLSRYNPETWLTYGSRRVRRIICVSEAVRRYMLSLGTPAWKAVTIHKGHDPTWYAPAPRAALTEWGIPADAFVVGCSAQMRSLKGLSVLLDAAALLPPNVHLLLAGHMDEGARRDLAGRTALAGRLHATGFRPDAPALMGACDAFVMPSLRREGFPRAVLEAMLQGVPAVVTTVGGMPEMVRDGEDGFVLPPGDPAALAGALARLANDPSLRARLGDSARAFATRSFPLQATMDRTEALYTEVLKEACPASSRS